MKLKKAIKKARKLGYDWVAVNENNQLIAFNIEPKSYWGLWTESSICTHQLIDIYTGKKHWQDTLRKVK